MLKIKINIVLILCFAIETICPIIISKYSDNQYNTRNTVVYKKRKKQKKLEFQSNIVYTEEHPFT